MDKVQFFTLPNDMTKHDAIKPSDVLVYLYLKMHDNPEHRCFPSLKVLSKESGAAINTIRTSISNLVKNDYIKIVTKGRKHFYYFSDIKKFEMFSEEFLMNKDISFREKAYIAASQQYMFKDIENYGKMSYSRKELSNILNVSEDSIYRCDNTLKNKGYLLELDMGIKDLGTGCSEKEKLFKLKKVGQAFLWKLKEHDDSINELKEAEANKDKLIEQLTKRIEVLEARSQQHEFIM